MLAVAQKSSISTVVRGRPWPKIVVEFSVPSGYNRYYTKQQSTHVEAVFLRARRVRPFSSANQLLSVPWQFEKRSVISHLLW
jgi:hypothetical protein